MPTSVSNPTPHRDGLSPRPRSPMPRIGSAQFTTAIQPRGQVRSRSTNPVSHGSTAHPLVPGWPSQLSAGGIQSPYIHRASGLLQIAVSTLLRTSSIGNRELLPAEHCRYGTRDLA